MQHMASFFLERIGIRYRNKGFCLYTLNKGYFKYQAEVFKLYPLNSRPLNFRAYGNSLLRNFTLQEWDHLVVW